MPIDSYWLMGDPFGTAVLIDEGHDFKGHWLKLIVQMIDAQHNSLLLLYDDAQSIYKRRQGLKFTLSSVGIEARGRTTILKINYRNTKEILTFAYRFAEQFVMEVNTDDEHLKMGKTIEIPTHDDFTALIYAYQGESGVHVGDEINSRLLKNKSLARLSEEGSIIIENRSTTEARFLVLAGKPIKQEIVQYGPFVMNSSEEIEQAISDYRNGILIQA